MAVDHIKANDTVGSTQPYEEIGRFRAPSNSSKSMLSSRATRIQVVAWTITVVPGLNVKKCSVFDQIPMQELISLGRYRNIILEQTLLRRPRHVQNL